MNILGSTRRDDFESRSGHPFFATDLLRRFGIRALLALAVAALFAFAPLATLYWFNELRLEPVAVVEPTQRVVVKPARHKHQQDRDEPGETALLQVTCDIPTFNGWQELLQDEDPLRDKSFIDSHYVHREQVYVRRAGLPEGLPPVPFALLGPPPVSVWLPAGDYEILVVHEAPGGEQHVEAWPGVVPWISVFTDCTLEARHKTVCRVALPHYNWGNPESFLPISNVTEEDRARQAAELGSFLTACEQATAIPTPAGYVLNLSEPRINHTEEHRGCVADFGDLQTVPREWTRDQIAAQRNALPSEATAARARLSRLVDWLGWREFLQGWFCYAAAGITGLVFTRWGAIALLEPWRRSETWWESLGLLVRIFLFFGGAWFLFLVLTDSSGWHGPVPFRLH